METIADYYQRLIDEGLSHREALSQITKEAAAPHKIPYEKTLEKQIRAQWTNERSNNTDLQTMLVSIFKEIMIPVNNRLEELEESLNNLQNRIQELENKPDPNRKYGKIKKEL